MPESATPISITTIQNILQPSTASTQGPIPAVNPSDNTPENSLVTLTVGDEIDTINVARTESALGVLFGILLTTLILAIIGWVWTLWKLKKVGKTLSNLDQSRWASSYLCCTILSHRWLSFQCRDRPINLSSNPAYSQHTIEYYSSASIGDGSQNSHEYELVHHKDTTPQ